jgi:hypothetical protein
VLDERAIQLEEVYLGLRTIEGLPAHRIPATRRQEWAGAGWAVTQEDTVRLTPDGWLRLDALVRSVSP